MASLRLARSEIERLCAELRSDLRKCRTELACHIAHAASIKRWGGFCRRGCITVCVCACSDWEMNPFCRVDSMSA